VLHMSNSQHRAAFQIKEARKFGEHRLGAGEWSRLSF
jgi:hypothetical protein